MFASEHVYMHMISRIVVHILIYSNMHMFTIYIHTYIHMHMHTHVHACAHMSKCTDMTILMQRALLVYVHVCFRACIRAYVLAHGGTTFMLTYIRMHMHTQVHACAHMSKCTDVRSCKESDVFLNTMRSETASRVHV